MATVRLTNRILDPSGTALTGVTVNARLKPPGGFRADTPFAEVGAQESTTTDSSGDWALLLERNANITPSGTEWEVEEQIPDSSGGPRTWSVAITTTVTTSVALKTALGL